MCEHGAYLDQSEDAWDGAGARRDGRYGFAGSRGLGTRFERRLVGQLGFQRRQLGLERRFQWWF